MNKEEWDANQRKRMTDDMSGVVTFKSQCSGCRYNKPPDCLRFKPEDKPEKYRWNEEECPYRDAT